MRLNLQLRLDSTLCALKPAWSPARLFSTGASGAYYSAHRGLFRDIAGTLPVNSPGQSVALMRDLSGKGNHATQPISNQRPTFGRHPVIGVRNLLPNNTPSGAAMGVLGAGGALPTGWESSFAGGAAGSIEVVGIGAEHIDLHIVQTASGGAPIIRPISVGAGLPTTQGDAWAFSLSLAIIAGDLAGNATAQLRGTERDSGGASLEAINFNTSVSVTSILTRHSGTAIIANPSAERMNPDLRIASTGPWDATFRISLPQCERGTVATGVQITGAGGFDVTEAGQRSVYYLQPDGVDDWMQLATPFTPEGGYTLASATGGVFDPIYGNISSSDANALRQRLVAAAGGRLRHDIASGASLVADNPVFAQRHVHIMRTNSATEGEVWANGNLMPSTRDGNLAPVSANALFRFGGSYASGRYYGGALLSMAMSEADRDLLLRHLAAISGVFS